MFLQIRRLARRHQLSAFITLQHAFDDGPQAVDAAGAKAAAEGVERQFAVERDAPDFALGAAVHTRHRAT